jgi:molybdopterin converting factor small subunit
MPPRHEPAAAAPATISVSCRLFARYAEILGREECRLTLPMPATVADAVRQLRRTLPQGSRLPEQPLAAVNRAHARPETLLADGDEVALLPPLAGG